MVDPDETFDGTWPFAARFHQVPAAGDARPFRLHYVDEGPPRAEPIVCLHGEPTWGYLYRKMIPGLAERWRVLVPDHMGFGKSDTPQDRPYTLRTHVENLTGWIEALDLRGITFIAQDWGGPIATQFTVRHPDRVRRRRARPAMLAEGLADPCRDPARARDRRLRGAVARASRRPAARRRPLLPGRRPRHARGADRAVHAVGDVSAGRARLRAMDVNRTELTPLLFLERAMHVHAPRIAAVYGQRRFTYAELGDARAPAGDRAAARGLAARRPRRGARAERARHARGALRRRARRRRAGRDQHPARRRRGALHPRALRRAAACWSTPSWRSRWATCRRPSSAW